MGHVFFIALIILSFVFATERIIFADCAYHLFEFIQTKHLQIQNHRFIAALTQVIPIIGVKSGWPLDALVITYSLSFSLLYYLYFIFIAHLLNERTVAIALVVFTAIFVTHTFFWIQSEFPQGLLLLFVIYALLRKKKMWLNLIVIPLLLVPLVYSHPLIIFPLSFLLLFLMNDEKLIEKKHGIALIVFALIIFFLKAKIFPQATSYEADKLSLRVLTRNLPHFFSFQSNRIFLKWLLTTYHLMLILFIAMSFFYYRKMNRNRMILLAGFFFFYAVLVNLAHPKISPDLQFYFENLYLPLSFFVAVAFVSDFFVERKKSLAAIILLGFCMLGIIRIIIASERYVRRFEYISSLVNSAEKFEEEKFILEKKYLDLPLLGLDWALPYETILASSLKSKNDAKIFFATSENPEMLLNDSYDALLLPWWKMNQHDLNATYFKIEKPQYKIVNDGQLFK